MKAIRVLSDERERGYIDFEILDENGNDDGNLYRYYNGDDKFTKVYGIRQNWSKAIRGNARKIITDYIKTVYKNNLAIAIII
jgi:hypothetical protein